MADLIGRRACPRLRAHVSSLRPSHSSRQKAPPPVSTSDVAFQRCIAPHCGACYGIEEVLVACSRCGNLLDVSYDWDRLEIPSSLQHFETKWARRSDPLCFSGVWRFRELLPFAPPDKTVTVGEGQTILQRADAVAAYTKLDPGCLYLQYEGLNPSGSFKDNGMSAAFTHARLVGANRAACASTGNTSASLAMYCAATRRMQRNHLCGIRENRLRETLTSTGIRRTDSSDPGRLRRRHATCERGRTRAEHLPGQ